MKINAPQPAKALRRDSETGRLNLITKLLVGTTLVLLAWSLAAIAASRMTEVELANIIELPVVKLNQVDTLAEIMTQLAEERVILVGETHTRYDHHLVQLEILKQLHQQSRNLALGVEWFQQPFQQHLDDFIAGKTSEEEMLHQTEYFERWRYDYRLYRPIMQYAREHKIPVIALNASRELTSALSQSGFDDLPSELKAQLPSSYDWSDKAYEKRLRNVFDSHPEYPGEFKDFLRGQLTWDESMAEGAAEFLKDNPETRMLVLAGSGHIEYGSGIPSRIKRRRDINMSTVLVSQDFRTASSQIADYLVLSTEKSLQPVGLIGALLETEGNLIVIKGFSHDSAAKDAGVSEGAVIVGVDDTEVENFASFKLALMDKRRGDTIDLHYVENADAGKKDKRTVNLELR